MNDHVELTVNRELEGVFGGLSIVTIVMCFLYSFSGDIETSRAWEGCAQYHLRCVARRALFITAANTPAQVCQHI